MYCAPYFVRPLPGSSWALLIRPATKMFAFPPEYGTATSILEPSMYPLELTKENPPRETSLTSTISSSNPGWRMHAFIFTCTRTCLRLFCSRSIRATDDSGTVLDWTPECPAGSSLEVCPQMVHAVHWLQDRGRLWFPSKTSV